MKSDYLLLGMENAHFMIHSLQENLDISSKSGKLTVESNLEKIKDRIDAIFVTVGTPSYIRK